MPEPGRKVFKLSANETPFGPSPKAKEVYKQAAAHLEDYPEGTSRVLREAIGRAYGLDPNRIICGAGSDEILNLLAHTYLSQGDEAISTAHGFLVYPIATMANGAKNVVAPETNFTADVDAILARVTPRTKLVWLANPNNPTGTYVPFDEVKRLRAGLPPHVLLVLDAAYSDYVSRNDYELGLELVATTENTVMTHTFSKIHGLAALRIGWMFGPANIIDAVNRIRGPFNVSTPAMLAAVAAIEDTAHVQMSKAFTEQWRNWLTEEIGKLGLKVTPSVANFVLIHFPEKGKTSTEADAFLTRRGLVLRALNNYGLPHALRMTIGTEEANRLVVDGLARLHGGQMNTTPIFRRVALIGFGLIGGSIARAARAQGLASEIVTTARSEKTRARVTELGIVDRVLETNAEAVKDADLVILCIPVGACGPVAQEIAPFLKAGAIVSDVGSVKGAIVREMAPHLPGECSFRPGPSGRRHRTFRSRLRLRRTLHQPLVHPHAARWHRSDGRRNPARVLGRHGRQGRDHDARSSRPGAGDHEPSAASDRLHHRRHRRRTGAGDVVGSDKVLRRRLSRFHPHRGVRSRRCGATCSSTTRKPCWKCSAPSTRISQSSPARSAATTAKRCSSTSPAPAPSAAASSRSARIRPRRISEGHIRR